jgi:hypothetical protein
VVVGHDVGDDGLLVRSFDVDVFRIEELSQPKFPVGQVEGVGQVLQGL